jgi:hypothetical protein
VPAQTYAALVIRNRGNNPTGDLSLSLEGEDNNRFSLSTYSVGSIEPGGTANFTITPSAGDLLPRDYAAKVQVSGGSVAGVSHTETLTVGIHGVIDLGYPNDSAKSYGSGWGFSTDTFTIAHGKAVVVTGSTSANKVMIGGGAAGKTYIRLQDAEITGLPSGNAIALNTASGGAKLMIDLADGTTNNMRTVTVNSAAIQVHSGTELIIMGTGTLTAASGGSWSASAAIGGDAGRDAGIITINGGTVTAYAGLYGTGIGGGGNTGGAGGAGGEITINGGTVTANCGKGAAIGGGMSGSGTGGAGGDITINGGTVVAVSDGGAGIGGGGSGGTGGAGGDLTINGGTVTAYATNGGAGIGGGGGGGGGANGGAGGEITINGGTVIAYSDTNNSGSSGIGGGGSQYSTCGAGGDIEISGGTVYAASSGMGKGIGPGNGVSTGSFTNGGTPVIFASSIYNGGAQYSAPAAGVAGNSSHAAVGMTATSSAPYVTAITITLAGGTSFTVPPMAVLTVPPIANLNLDGNTLTNNGTVKNNGIVCNGTVNAGNWSGNDPQ